MPLPKYYIITCQMEKQRKVGVDVENSEIIRKWGNK